RTPRAPRSRPAARRLGDLPDALRSRRVPASLRGLRRALPRVSAGARDRDPRRPRRADRGARAPAVGAPPGLLLPLDRARAAHEREPDRASGLAALRAHWLLRRARRPRAAQPGTAPTH